MTESCLGKSPQQEVLVLFISEKLGKLALLFGISSKLLLFVQVLVMLEQSGDLKKVAEIKPVSSQFSKLQLYSYRHCSLWSQQSTNTYLIKVLKILQYSLPKNSVYQKLGFRSIERSNIYKCQNYDIKAYQSKYQFIFLVFATLIKMSDKYLYSFHLTRHKQ